MREMRTSTAGRLQTAKFLPRARPPARPRRFLWRHQRLDQRGEAVEGLATELQPAGRLEHASPDYLPGRRAQPESEAGKKLEQRSDDADGPPAGATSTKLADVLGTRTETMRRCRPRHTQHHRANQSLIAERKTHTRLAGRVQLGQCAAADVRVRRDLSASQRRRNLGNQYSGRLELYHHRFCVVDRDRACWHADLGHFAADAPEVADDHQPHRRGDDDLWRDVRRHVSAAAPGAAHGTSSGCCRIPTRCGFGRNSAARWCGTCSP